MTATRMTLQAVIQAIKLDLSTLKNRSIRGMAATLTLTKLVGLLEFLSC